MSFSINGRSPVGVTSCLLMLVLSTLVANPVFAAADKSSTQVVSEPSLEGYESHMLEVKFKDTTRVRLRSGVLEDLNKSNAVAADLNRLLTDFPSQTWTRSHSISESKLDAMRTNGLARSDRSLPDLNLYFQLQLPKSMSPGKAKQLLESYDSVQGAYYVPKPSPLPAAPDYSDPLNPDTQGYLNAAPEGVDARGVWSPGWDGNGVQVCDVEYNVNFDHDDLPHITVLSGVTVDPFNDNNHGTAVFGEMVGLDDGTGVKGIAYNMSGSYFAAASTNSGFNVGRAIIQCAAAMQPGDIILIEQQTFGPNGCGVDQFGCVPVEWVKSTYDAIVTAVANEIIVVETSGNGSQDLDDPIYSTGNDNHWPFLAENDSGAIIVTGGASDASHGPLSFTTFGSTVDLQAWGQNITTTGYGNLFNSEGANRHYTGTFGGSSGAGPIVAGGIAVLQSGYRDLLGGVASPEAMLQVLQETGTSGSGVLQDVPLPNLLAARAAIENIIYVDSSAAGAEDGSSWSDAYRELQEALFVAIPGTTIAVAEGSQFPDFDPVLGVITSNPADTFQLMNGVTLLGGYPSGGGLRDPDANVSFLNGTIGAINSYHVVTGSGTDSSAILDGFVISGGEATGAGSNENVGGGIYINAGSPIIRNSTLANNSATEGGGAYVVNGNPTFVDVTLSDNSASNRGGGLYNAASGTQLRNVTFLNNQADSEGGGLISEGAGSANITGARFHGNSANRAGALANWPNSNLTVENAIFTGNSATDLGGAINNFQGTLLLNNVTMAGNTAPNGGAGIYLFDPATIKNSIVWGNNGEQIGGIAGTVFDSIVQGGYAGSNVINGNPSFRDLDGADNIIGTVDDDVRFTGTGTVARNTADFAIANDCVGTDISGNPRVSQCDMGAHEYRGSVGSLYNSGELDEEHLAESSDQTGLGGPLRQSADDFVIGPNEACDIRAISASLFDPTTTIQAVAEIYADAGGLPAETPLNSYSVGAVPGQSLGALNGARLWEYIFIIPPVRLSEGTYWMSVYGAEEDLDDGPVKWVSAGEGTVQSNPYHFREVGFGWVDGGLFAGDVSRDLAMGIDAICGCGTDAGCDDGDPATSDSCDNLVCTNLLRPDNDDFFNATQLMAGDSFTGTLLGGTNDGGNSVGITGQRDVWYQVTPSVSGSLRVNTCGSSGTHNVDTTLSVHTADGNPGTTVNELEANDDYQSGSDPAACDGEPSDLDSAINLTVQGGTSLLIRVSEYDVDANGGDDFILNLDFIPEVDSDGDGVLDSVDNCTDVINAGQQDTNGDGIGNACDADVNNDCVVNFLDISLFPPTFNTATGDPGYNANFDLNSSGNINFLDYIGFTSAFGTPPGPSANACVPGLGT